MSLHAALAHVQTALIPNAPLPVVAGTGHDAASASSGSPSGGFVDVLVVACKELLGVSYLERVQCSVSLCTHPVSGTPSAICSTELTTPFAPITKAEASWLTLSAPTVDASASIVQSLRLRLPFDMSKLRKPAGSQDCSLDLKVRSRL